MSHNSENGINTLTTSTVLRDVSNTLNHTTLKIKIKELIKNTESLKNEMSEIIMSIQPKWNDIIKNEDPVANQDYCMFVYYFVKNHTSTKDKLNAELKTLNSDIQKYKTLNPSESYQDTFNLNEIKDNFKYINEMLQMADSST